MTYAHLSSSTDNTQAPREPLPTVAAVVVTRNRSDLLRKTLQSVRDSSYPVSEVIVSDDSSTDETARMLEAEFPEVRRVEGPRRGISANRNWGMSHVSSAYILLSDDDMLVDRSFIGRAVQEMQKPKVGIVFCAVDDGGQLILPNTFNLLGFSKRKYQPGMAYNTANQQCFLLSRPIARDLPYDEIIEAYGYEEMDFAYRVAAAGYQIRCLSNCAHTHLAPNANQPSRPEKDACRLYVTYKRLAYIDRHPLKSWLFLGLALPHHILASVRRSGLRGIRDAFVHIWMAGRMINAYRRTRPKRRMLQAAM